LEACSLDRLSIFVLMISAAIIGPSACASVERVISADEVLAKIKAGDPANFDSCMIMGDLNLSAITFSGPVHFNRTIFQDEVNFHQTTLMRDAYFNGAEFNDFVDFESAEFNDFADFWSAGFNDIAIFKNAGFNGNAGFIGAEFNDAAYFNGAEFSGDVSFIGAEFNDFADFRSAEFNDIAYFRGAEFNDSADFSGAGFNGIADFQNAFFAGNLNFDGIRFKGDALFENATFQRELSLTRARYDRLYLQWDSLKGGLAYDDAAYMSLMKNFKDLGYYEDYDNCYYNYRIAHRSVPWPSVPDGEETARKIIDYPLDWFYGYGTKPFNAFIISLIIVTAFSVFWWAMGLGGPKDKTKESLPQGEEWPDGDITDILGYSVTVFLSGTKFFIDTPALPRIDGRSRSLVKKAFVLERLLGAFFSILPFIAISGTIVRA